MPLIGLERPKGILVVNTDKLLGAMAMNTEEGKTAVVLIFDALSPETKTDEKGNEYREMDLYTVAINCKDLSEAKHILRKLGVQGL